ncbi:MAG: hypothetical protein IKF90_21425 [Parasporobacterium sp.]|nr:hypothetical protein [Parasporobacterium sp.]
MNININLIKKQGDLYDLIVRENKIIELYHKDGDASGELIFCVFEPSSNTLREIEPEVKKADFVHFHISYQPCSEVYYAVSKENDDETVDIEIYSYSLIENESRLLCSLKETSDVLYGQKRVRAFVLSKTQIFIQTEVVNASAAKKLMGNIVFSQALYDSETHTAVEVVEENLKNNGINSIIPLNDSEVMIKTGTSFLEDSRLTYGSEKDALIESVYITTIAKFTADIALKLKNIDMKLLTSTYFEKYILKPEVKDDYIAYNVVDVDNKESDCVFYNFISGEKITCKNSDISLNDLRLAYVIDNIPYVRRYINNSCEFINMNTAENDISFYDEDFVDVCGNLFITSRQHGRKTHMRVYKYPHMDVILEETCGYIAGIMHDNNYYIYVDR